MPRLMPIPRQTLLRTYPIRTFAATHRAFANTADKNAHDSTPGWKGRDGEDHALNRPPLDVQAEPSHQARKDKEQGKEGSQAISQKDERNSNKRAKEEHPEAPEPIIGMNTGMFIPCFIQVRTCLIPSIRTRHERTLISGADLLLNTENCIVRFGVEIWIYIRKLRMSFLPTDTIASSATLRPPSPSMNATGASPITFRATSATVLLFFTRTQSRNTGPELPVPVPKL